MKHLDISYSKIGKLGEDIVCMFLENEDFIILERNYRQKCGEIDIVAAQDGITHFIEVKSVSRNLGVTHETNGYNPEDNVHPEKLRKVSKTIETYLAKNPKIETWQFDVALCYIDVKTKKASVKILDNIIL